MTREPMQSIAAPEDLKRREALRTGVVLLAGAAATAGMLASGPAHAAKVSQATAMYQTSPHGQQRCEGCVHFIPGSTASANGSCQIVEGSISPNGWCVLFAPKA